MNPPDFQSHTYRAVWHGCQLVFNLLYRTEVAGLEHIPETGPFILASNHASYLDPPIIGSYLPRELHYFARKTLFKGHFGRLISDLNSIPIDRDGGSDLQAFRAVFNALKQGGGILIFPEGTRTHDGQLAHVKSGLGMLACRAQVPVIPARIFGSYAIWSRFQHRPAWQKNLGLTIGAPLPPAAYDPGKAALERNQTASDRIMAAIAALPPPFSRRAV